MSLTEPIVAPAAPPLPSESSRIDTVEALDALYGPPGRVAVQKQMSRLDTHCRRFIALSPFVLIATTGEDGLGDVSPKGDPAGFVTVLDDVTLAIPDRPGNRRLDSLRNLVRRPGVGLLFMVPGIDETLRVNGTAAIHDDPALNAALAVNGRPALAAIVVTVHEVYLHCGKALMRSRLWDAASRVAREDVPTLGRMLRDQVGTSRVPDDQAGILAMYEKELY